MIRGHFARAHADAPTASPKEDEVRVSLVIEDAHGFVHHYDDIVTTSQAATNALRTLAHMGAQKCPRLVQKFARAT